MKLVLSITALALAAAAAAPATAQTTDELRQQLEAQKAINEQLRKRVQDLERELSGAPAAPALRPAERGAAAAEAESAEGTTAIEEALVAKGLVLLPPGSFRLSPGVSWTHNGADAIHTRSDTYTGNLALQAGLPLGMMLSASAPYVHRNTSIGSNSGMGDLSLALSKTLNSESDRLPSFVASLGYTHDNGKDPFKSVPIGSGFRSVSASLSALKRMDPLALYGGLSYSHSYAKDVSEDNLFGLSHFTGRIAPGAVWSYRLGASLAATPDATLDASLSGAFVRRSDVRSDTAGSLKLPRSTIAVINLGAGFVLSRQVSLLLSAGAGATKDSPDFIFSTSLAYRF